MQRSAILKKASGIPTLISSLSPMNRVSDQVLPLCLFRSMVQFTLSGVSRSSARIRTALNWLHPGVISQAKTIIFGKPNQEVASTSHVERSKLTVRMHMRRFTRLTNAFSKKLENLKAAFALHAVWYNFVRVHKTLRCTPAQEAGIVASIWEMEDVLNAA